MATKIEFTQNLLVISFLNMFMSNALRERVKLQYQPFTWVYLAFSNLKFLKYTCVSHFIFLFDQSFYSMLTPQHLSCNLHILILPLPRLFIWNFTLLFIRGKDHIDAKFAVELFQKRPSKKSPENSLKRFIRYMKNMNLPKIL